MVDVQDCKSLVKYMLPIIAPPRGRLDITGERAYIRQRALQDEIRTAPSSSTQQKDCIDSLPPTTPVTSHPAPKVSSATTIRKKRPRSSEVIEIDSDSDSPVIMLATSHRRQLQRLVKEEPSPETMAGHSLAPLSTKTWPAEFSVAEVSSGFLRIEELAARWDYTVKRAFEEVFMVPYVNGTYYSHLQRWKRATQDSRNASDGPWQNFMKAARAPDADIKAARKRVKRQSAKSALAPASTTSSVD